MADEDIAVADEPAIEVEGETEMPAHVRSARLVFLAGLVPFVVLAAWLYAIAPDHPWRDGTILMLKTYAAVSLSFVAGARWGAALDADAQTARPIFLVSVIPVLLGWLAIAMNVPYAFAVLAVAFAAHGAWDSLGVQREMLPEWYGRLRMMVTAMVVAMMIVAFAATA
jgi:hypothetical protein